MRPNLTLSLQSDCAATNLTPPAVDVKHGEPVVGDDGADVTFEDAPRLPQVQREVVALGVTTSVRLDR